MDLNAKFHRSKFKEHYQSLKSINDPKSYASLLEQAADNYQQQHKPEANKFINDLLSKDSMVFLREVFSPNHNGFELKNFQQLPFGDNQEIWLDNKCVMINAIHFMQHWQQIESDVQSYG